MTVNRHTAKRQIAASRALLSWIRTRGLSAATSATDADRAQQLLGQLEDTTEALARQAYTPPPIRTR